MSPLLEQVSTFVISVLISIVVFAMSGWAQFVNSILSMLFTSRLEPEPEQGKHPKEVPSPSTNHAAVVNEPNAIQTKAVNVSYLRKRTMTPRRSLSGVRVTPKKWKSTDLLMEDIRQDKLKNIDGDVASKSTLADIHKIKDTRKADKMSSSRTNKRFRMTRKRCGAGLQEFDQFQLQMKLKQAELQKEMEQMIGAVNHLEISLADTTKQLTDITTAVREMEAKQKSNAVTPNNPEMDSSTDAVLHNVMVTSPALDEVDRFQPEEDELPNTDNPQPDNQSVQIQVPCEEEQPEIQSVQTEVPYEEESEQDLDQPLSHYYIKGSHNTYLVGNQLSGASTIDGYRRAIANKCKCLELDLHDGPRGEPVIYHGWTLTSKIVARKVLKHGIKPYFSKDDLPLILGMDDHIRSAKQRKVFIQQIKTILGDFIYVDNIEEMARLPSPNQLRGKIIVKAPRAEWAELANICQAVPFPHAVLKENSENGKWFEISSLSEHRLNKLLKPSIMDKILGNGSTVEKAKKRKMRQITTNRLIRCHPGGERQLSGNFNPIPGMNAGCQIAAMNVQTKCSDLAIYESRFSHAGNTGYALKPAFLLDCTAPRSSPKRITVKVISGHCIPQTGKKRRIPTFVKIRIDGKREDKAEKSTRKVDDDGLNCKWEEELRFDVGVPELGFLLFQVKRSQYFGLKSPSVASYAIPVDNLVNGLFSIPLRDWNLVPLENAFLLARVTIEDQLA